MSRAYSSFIPADQIAAVRGWQFDAVNQSELSIAAKLQAQAHAEQTAREENARNAGLKEGFDEGYQRGYEAGYQSGHREGFDEGHSQAQEEGQRQMAEYLDNQGKEAAQHLLSVVASARTQLERVEQDMASGVLDLACALAQQVLRHALTTQPEVLQSVVQEAVGMLMADSKTAVLRMHPQDVEVFAQQFEPQLHTLFPHLALQLVPDATLTRGGCVLDAAGTVVDATVERRWQRAVARLGMQIPWESDDASPA